MRYKQTIEPSNVPKPNGPYSSGIEVQAKNGKMIFISGQAPLEPSTKDLVEGDRKIQTRLVLHHIEEILKGAGAKIEDVVKMDIFLVDLNDLPFVEEECANWFNGSIKPVRQVLEVKKLGYNSPLEISCIAFIPDPN